MRPSDLGAFGPLWNIAFNLGAIPLPSGQTFFVFYPVLPWFGIMALGYGLGPIFRLDPQQRTRILAWIGVLMTIGFVALRAINWYGDPRPWSTQNDWLRTLFSFLNCLKYPPSLLYVLMAIGPAMLLLAWLQRPLGRIAGVLVTYGRVPLFYYILHIFLIHGLAAIIATLTHGSAPWMFTGLPNSLPGTELPPTYGYGLPVVYLVWVTVLIALYPLCKWFGDLKKSGEHKWLSYL